MYKQKINVLYNFNTIYAYRLNLGEFLWYLQWKRRSCNPNCPITLFTLVGLKRNAIPYIIISLTNTDQRELSKVLIELKAAIK